MMRVVFDLQPVERSPLDLRSIQKEKGVILGIAELDELQELARLSIGEALESYDISDEWKEHLSLTHNAAHFLQVTDSQPSAR